MLISFRDIKLLEKLNHCKYIEFKLIFKVIFCTFLIDLFK